MFVRAFSPDDVDTARQLSELEGWDLSAADWHCLIRLEPQGCFVAEADGRAVGLVTTIAYGKLGWIGTLVVAAAERRQGYGQALLDAAVGHLLDRGVRTVGVDATRQSVPLYTGARFHAAFDMLHLQRRALPPPTAIADTLLPLEAKHLHAVSMFDWAFFGGPRRRLLADLLQRSPVAYLARGEAGEAGYLLARHGEVWTIGPWVCLRSAEALLTSALAAIGPQTVRLAVPGVNRQALDLLRTYRFEPCGRQVRLYYGDEEGIGQPEHIYAGASPGKG